MNQTPLSLYRNAKESYHRKLEFSPLVNWWTKKIDQKYSLISIVSFQTSEEGWIRIQLRVCTYKFELDNWQWFAQLTINLFHKIYGVMLKCRNSIELKRMIISWKSYSVNFTETWDMCVLCVVCVCVCVSICYCISYYHGWLAQNNPLSYFI